MISKLMEVLGEIGIEPTAEDLADILWLAQHIDEPFPSFEEHRFENQDNKQQPLVPKDEFIELPPRSPFVAPEIQVKEEDEKPPRTLKLYVDTPDCKKDLKSGPGIEGIPFRTPGGSALPGKLEISRSLRPLMRKVPSRRRMILDEDTTAGNIAESDIWLPTLKPEPSRWLDVVLVFDESPSMIIWHETAFELKELLERQGAFRNVQMWSFIYDDENRSISLQPGTGFGVSRRVSRAPKELIDPTGRRLILVISDCVSTAWHNGTVSHMLKVWNDNSRVTIVQMLPYYLWERTGLREAENVYLRCKNSETVNAKLEIESSLADFEDKPAKGLKLPVVTLEDRSILPWAKSLTARGAVWIPGILLKLHNRPHADDDKSKHGSTYSKPSAEYRLNWFRDTASPEAQELVSCLAALPLSLPVMRLAQRVILPKSRQIHLAEIFLSGLIKREEALNTSLSLESQTFEFEEGIRELIISRTLIRDTINNLSTFISNYTGSSIDFRAMLAAPSSIRDVFRKDAYRHFAEVTAKVLRRLGGEYRHLAEQIEQERPVPKGGGGIPLPEPDPPTEAPPSGPDTVPPGSQDLGEPEPKPIPGGKPFEGEVAFLFDLLGYEVKQNIQLAGMHIDMLIEKKEILVPLRFIVECKDRVIDRDDLDQIVVKQKRALKLGLDCHWITVCSLEFTALSRTALEGAGITCVTYRELLNEVVPLEPYVKELINAYASQTTEKWGGKNLFIQPDLRTDAGNELTPALEYIRTWLRKQGSSFLAVLGDLGTGKTTLLSYLAYDLGRSFLDDPLRYPAPILIPLMEVRKEVSLDGIIARHFRDRKLDSIIYSRFAPLVQNGKAILLFDAFDEMADRVHWDVTVSNFHELRRASDQGGTAVLSCRTHYFKDSVEQAALLGQRPSEHENETDGHPEESRQGNAEVVYLQEFNDEQILDYLKRARPDTYQGDSDKISTSHNLRELAHSPLLLDMIVKTLPELQEGQSIEAASLYTVYTGRWLDREGKKQRILNRETKLRLMLELAWRFWEREESSISYLELTDFVEWLSAQKKVNFGDEAAEDVAREMHGATFLIRGGDGNFSFAHHSFQEYFLALRLLEEIKGTADSAGTCLNTRRLDRRVIYFLTHLDKEDEMLGPLREILQSPYRKQVSENSLQILYWSGRIRCGMEERIDDPTKLRQLMATRLPRGPNLQQANLEGIVLEGVVLHGAQMGGAYLNDAILNHAGFPSADFYGAFLVGASCRETIFSRCNLRKANLEKAVLDGADFTEATLEDAVVGLTALRGATVPGKLNGIGGVKDTLSIETDRAALMAHREFLPIIQLGEASGVQSGSFSPDGRFLACGGLDGVVRLWRTEDGRLIRTLAGHQGGVRSVSFSPNGALLASGSDDKTVRLWDPSTGKSLHILAGHWEGVLCVSFSPNGALLASGSGDKTVWLWEPSTGTRFLTLTGHRGGVLCVSFSPDGALVASGSDDTTVRLWKLSTEKSLGTLKGHYKRVRSLSFSHNGALLASGSDDTTVRLWDPSTGKSLSILKEHRQEVRSVSFSHEGTPLLASGSNDGTVRLWDPSTGKNLHTLRGHGGGVGSVSFSHDGEFLASGSDDKTVQLWNPSTGESLRTLERNRQGVLSVSFSPDGEFLASGSNDTTVQLWKPSTGESLPALEGHRQGVLSVSFSPDGEFLASGSNDTTVQLWKPSTRKSLRTLRGHTRGVRSLSFSQVGALLASGSIDTTVRLWDPSTGESLYTLEGHRGEVWSVSFSPDGTLLASGSYDRTVQLWNPSTGESPPALEGHREGVLSVSFSPDGALLASGSNDRTVRLWDPSTGESLHTLEGHREGVLSVSFSPDGALLASGSYDNTVQLWNSRTGKRLATLFGHLGAVTSVVFARNRKYLIAASVAGSLQFWDYHKEEVFLYRYEFGPGAWLDLLPDGRFDASPEGMRYLCYTEQGTFNSHRAEELEKEFRDPDHVREVLARYLA
jgi:WD40 repeat protein/uncharacterized protein YjbI with pentapeptide repeats